MIAEKMFELYKKAVSPHIMAQCKFYPTCSEYFLLAVKRYGYFVGMLKTLYRLLRCNPFSRGGVDLP